MPSIRGPHRGLGSEAGACSRPRTEQARAVEHTGRMQTCMEARESWSRTAETGFCEAGRARGR